MRLNNFNLVAPFYDLLAKLIFGDQLIQAQSHFLKILPPGKKVLFVGGGTGKLLLYPFFKSASHIDYVELSSNMLEKAKKNGQHLSNVNYLEQDFFQVEGEYDIIICNFFLDCFDQEHLSKAVTHLHKRCSKEGKVLVTDFRNTNNESQRWLIYLMVGFFRVIAHLQAKRLLAINQYMLKSFLLDEIVSKERSIIFSAVYQPS